MWQHSGPDLPLEESLSGPWQGGKSLESEPSDMGHEGLMWSYVLGGKWVLTQDNYVSSLTEDTAASSETHLDDSAQNLLSSQAIIRIQQ